MDYRSTLVLILFLVFYQSCEQKQNYEDLKEAYDQVDNQFNQLKEIDRSRFYLENTLFPDINLNDSLRISELGERYLYLRLSEKHCQECIKDFASFVNAHFAGRKQLIVVLGEFRSDRTMLIYLRRLNLLDSNWFLINGAIEHPLEDAQAAYAFRLNRENRIDNLWLPHFSLPSLSEEYILAMANRLNKD